MPATHRLRLFRRHLKDCTQKYPKDMRITEADSVKATGRRQCSCTIVAQGTLPSGKFLKHPSTGEHTWAEAHKVAALWWSWGDTAPGASVVKELEQSVPQRATTVADAVETFLAKKSGENLTPDLVRQHEQLLRTRLIEFSKANGQLYIEQCDNAGFWLEFRRSWKNLNPTHNRKPQDGVIPVVDVAPTTAKRLLSQTREFVRFCIDREWLKKEWTAKRFIKVSVRTEPKEPFSDSDVCAIFEATQLVKDGHGRTGQYNAVELRAFCYVLRFSGLRIGDAVRLTPDNLVARPGDPDHFALRVYMAKTRKHVYIPIPSGDVPGQPNVAAALQALPLKRGKFYFLGGLGKLRSNQASWRERITRLMSLAEASGHKLSVHGHPHRFSPDISRDLWQKAAVHGITEFPHKQLRPTNERLLL